MTKKSSDCPDEQSGGRVPRQARGPEIYFAARPRQPESGRMLGRSQIHKPPSGNQLRRESWGGIVRHFRGGRTLDRYHRLTGAGRVSGFSVPYPARPGGRAGQRSVQLRHPGPERAGGFGSLTEMKRIRMRCRAPEGGSQCKANVRAT